MNDSNENEYTPLPTELCAGGFTEEPDPMEDAGVAAQVDHEVNEKAYDQMLKENGIVLPTFYRTNLDAPVTSVQEKLQHFKMSPDTCRLSQLDIKEILKDIPEEIRDSMVVYGSAALVLYGLLPTCKDVNIRALTPSAFNIMVAQYGNGDNPENWNVVIPSDTTSMALMKVHDLLTVTLYPDKAQSIYGRPDPDEAKRFIDGIAIDTITEMQAYYVYKLGRSTSDEIRAKNTHYKEIIDSVNDEMFTLLNFIENR